jgi:hypothetical protein
MDNQDGFGWLREIQRRNREPDTGWRDAVIEGIFWLMVIGGAAVATGMLR